MDRNITHPPNRILAALALLAFAVAAVVAGIFAITAPAQTITPVALAIVAVVAVAALAITNKVQGESPLDTVINMLFEAFTAVAMILGIGTATRTAFAGMDIDDTTQLRRRDTDSGFGIGTVLHRRQVGTDTTQMHRSWRHGVIDVDARRGRGVITQT